MSRIVDWFPTYCRLICKKTFVDLFVGTVIFFINMVKDCIPPHFSNFCLAITSVRRIVRNMSIIEAEALRKIISVWQPLTISVKRRLTGLCAFLLVVFSGSVFENCFTRKLVRIAAHQISDMFCVAVIEIWDKVFKNGPSKICVRQPLKNLKWYVWSA